MVDQEFRYFEFGEFRLDSFRRTLQKNGLDVHLTPRAFDLLHVFLQNENRILTHDELLDLVWDGAFVEQSNLKKSVSALRQALGDSSEAVNFISTIRSKGYRFISPVRASRDGAETVLLRETRSEITIEDVFDDVEPDRTGRIVPVQLGAAAKRRSAVANLAFIGVAAAILFAVTFSVWRYLRPAEFNYSVESVKTTKIVADGVVANTIGISGDGKYIVYPVVDKAGSSLVVKQLATESARTLVPPKQEIGFWGYNFTPDNEYIYYIINDFADPTRNGLYRIPFLGGTPRLIFEKANGYVTFSPDGKRVAFRRTTDDFHTEIVSVDLDGRGAKIIRSFDERYRVWGVVWTSDGKDLLCTLRRRDDDKMVYYVAEISISDGTERVIVPEKTTSLISAVWLPGKQSLLFSMGEPNSVMRQIWQYFPATGDQRRVTNDNVGYWFLSLTVDGKTLVTTQETRPTAIWVADLDLSNFRRITSGTNEFLRAFWTADGNIVYQTVENRQESLWSSTVDGSQKLALTSGGDSSDINSRISADARTITFASRRSGTSQVWSVDTDGRNLRQLTNDLNTPATEAKLLADGQTLIYSAYISPSGWTLFKRTPGESDHQLTNVTVQSWDVSPDERMLAYSAIDRGTKKYKLFVQSLETGQILRTFDVRVTNALCWTRDGKALIVGSRSKDTLSEITIQPIDGSAPRVFDDQTAELFSERLWWLDTSHDGKSVLAVKGEIQSNVVVIKPE